MFVSAISLPLPFELLPLLGGISGGCVKFRPFGSSGLASLFPTVSSRGRVVLGCRHLERPFRRWLFLFKYGIAVRIRLSCIATCKGWICLARYRCWSIFFTFRAVYLYGRRNRCGGFSLRCLSKRMACFRTPEISWYFLYLRIN